MATSASLLVWKVVTASFKAISKLDINNPEQRELVSRLLEIVNLANATSRDSLGSGSKPMITIEMEDWRLFRDFYPED